jgi:O-methyltransferase
VMSPAERVFEIAWRYRDFTLMNPAILGNTLLLCQEKAPNTGCIVEAGVWKGGASAAMAEAMPGRTHYLFDSFDGLPPAQPIDGPAARNYQTNTKAESYRDNCLIEQLYAETAMHIAAASDRATIIPGRFDATMPAFVPAEPIGILRIDCDWYASVMTTLLCLYSHVQTGGLVIVDDYYVWDGCGHAVHNFLYEKRSVSRLREYAGICYWTKTDA